jgi:hypothetical protein
MTIKVKIARIPKCDFCDEVDAIIDGATLYGPWAYMCETCYGLHGVGKLGTGYGQELVAIGEEK